MKVLIILGHPNNESYNHAIAQTCVSQIEANGHSVLFHDLYAEHFNPLLSLDIEAENTELDNLIKTHREDLMNCDGIIVIHPNWWGQPPAIIKGWLDRVLSPGVAYQFVEKDGKHVLLGLLKAKNAIVINTSNTPSEAGDNLLDSIWTDRVFKFCGVNNVECMNISVIKDSDVSQRNKWLAEIKEMMNTYFGQK